MPDTRLQWSFKHAPGFSALITDDERCHVTQPRARINVSCSRAGHKGVKGHKTATREGQQRTAKDGCQIGNSSLKKSYRVYLLANEIDSQREHNFDGFLASY